MTERPPSASKSPQAGPVAENWEGPRRPKVAKMFSIGATRLPKARIGARPYWASRNRPAERSRRDRPQGSAAGKKCRAGPRRAPSTSPGPMVLRTPNHRPGPQPETVERQHDPIKANPPGGPRPTSINGSRLISLNHTMAPPKNRPVRRRMKPTEKKEHKSSGRLKMPRLPQENRRATRPKPGPRALVVLISADMGFNHPPSPPVIQQPLPGRVKTAVPPPARNPF